MVTDGTSLPGADDKAGIVEIMEAICYLQEHPEINHGTIALDLHQTKKSVVVHINLMLTVSMLILLILWMVVNMENYNMKALIAEAVITCHGVNVHPGSAKMQW